MPGHSIWIGVAMRMIARIASGAILCGLMLGGIYPASAQSTSVQSAVNVTPRDCSVAITTGGTAQNIITASPSIHGFVIMNVDNTNGSGEPVGVSFTGTASIGASGTYVLAAPVATTYAFPGSFSTPLGFGPNHSVSVIAATTGHIISCTRW